MPTKGTRGSDAAVGVTISTDGMPGELAAYGIAPHLSGSGSFFTSVNFVDPQSRKSSGVAYTGIPVGESNTLAKGSYDPELIVANFSSTARNVSVSSATTVSGTPKAHAIASIRMEAGSVQTLKLDRMTESADMLNSLVVHSDGQPGDIGTKLFSRNRRSHPNVVEMIERDESDAENAGGHPWAVSGGITSVLYLFNHDTTEDQINVRFGTPKGSWMKVYTLAPMETRAININDLIKNQEVDDAGHKLAIGAKTGEVGWQSASTKVAGRVLQSNAEEGLARNFSCSNYVSQCGNSLTPYTIFIAGYTDSDSLGSITPIWDVFHLHPPTSCSCSGGTSTSGSLPLTYGWLSGNSSIANVTGGSTSALSTWTGMGVGSTTATYNSYQSTYSINCVGQAPATSNATVQITKVDVINAISAGGSPNSTKIKVTLYVPLAPTSAQSVNLSLSTVSGSPSNNNASYTALQNVPVPTNVVSPIIVEFTATANALTQAGSIIVGSTLSGASSGLTIQPPTGGLEKGTITVNP